MGNSIDEKQIICCNFESGHILYEDRSIQCTRLAGGEGVTLMRGLQKNKDPFFLERLDLCKDINIYYKNIFMSVNIKSYKISDFCF